MDKKEFEFRIDKIKKLVEQGDNESAMKIADSIDWRRVRSTSLLTMASRIYEKNGEYTDAKDILLLAYERAPIGKGILYKLTDLAIREGNVQEAEAYYREYCELADDDDPNQPLLRYLVLDAKNAPIEQQISALEEYCRKDLDEKWLYHLAELYKEAGREEDCVAACDKIMLMFGIGKYVDRAMRLKLEFAPLNRYQMDLVENREQYEEKLRQIQERYREEEEDENEIYDEEMPEDEPEEEAPAEEKLVNDAPEETYAEPEEAPAGEEPVREPEEKPAEAPETEAAAEPAGEALSEEEPEEEPEEAPAEAAAKAPEEEPAGEPVNEPEPEEASMPEEEVPAEEEKTILAGDPDSVMPVKSTLEEDLAVSLHEARAEEELAREISRIEPFIRAEENPEAKTRVFHRVGEKAVAEEAGEAVKEAVKEAAPEVKAEETAPAPAPEPEAPASEKEAPAEAVEEMVFEDLDEEPEEVIRNYCMVSLEEGEDGIRKAKEILHGIHEKTGSRNPAAKISGQKLSAKGFLQTLSRLEGRDLVIDQAAGLDDAAAAELSGFLAEGPHDFCILLMDTAKNLGALEERCPDLANALDPEGAFIAAAKTAAEAEAEARAIAEKERLSREERLAAEKEAAAAAEAAAELEAEKARKQAEAEAREEAEKKSREEYEKDGGAGEEELEIEEFAEYACEYARKIDCSISGKSRLALCERAEMMKEDGERLTRSGAEELIEHAADLAEKKSIGKLFSKQYDKDGLLILREKHFFD